MKKAIILCLSIIMGITIIGTLVCLYVKHMQDNNTPNTSVQDTVVYPIVEKLEDVVDIVEAEDEVSEVIEEPEEKERVPLFEIMFDNGNEADYEADSTDYSKSIRFVATENIYSVKLLGLSAENIGEDGEITFEYSPMYEHGDMKANDSITVLMTLPEIIPLYAVSYISEDGYIYYDSVNQSGEDGSLYLSTYEVHEVDDEQAD